MLCQIPGVPIGVGQVQPYFKSEISISICFCKCCRENLRMVFNR